MKLQPEHVKGARGILSMSRADLAVAAGVSEDTIKLFETGKTEPRQDTLWRIQAALEQRGIAFFNGDKPTVQLDRSKAVTPT